MQASPWKAGDAHAGQDRRPVAQALSLGLVPSSPWLIGAEPLPVAHTYQWPDTFQTLRYRDTCTDAEASPGV